ncbi:MAG: C39 family peptidase [Candidatus Neomarinimicrobiota bacterium]
MLLLIWIGISCFANDIKEINGVMSLIKADTVEIPQSPEVKVIQGVPAYIWSYGCFPTAVAMMLGYWDNHGFPNIYTGPTNDGNMPITNNGWWPGGIGGSDGECPLSASHSGIDDDENRGHVDDYWVEEYSVLPDPFVTNGWTEHQPDCIADFCGSNQKRWKNKDGGTNVVFNYSPVYDYTDKEPDSIRDGCHGIRLFLQSRGYDALINYSQYKYGYNGINEGFTLQNFKSEIDNGNPVIIHLKPLFSNIEKHAVIAFGYNGNNIYLHDTWDDVDHQMSWDDYYSIYKIYAVTVIHLTENPPVPQNFTGSWSNNHPKISWNAVPVSDLNHYEIWKKRGGGSWFLRTTTTATYWIDEQETKYTYPSTKEYVYYKICAVDDEDNKSDFTAEKSFCVNAWLEKSNPADSGAVALASNTPEVLLLYPSAPNPFNNSTTIRFSLPTATTVDLLICDINGKVVRNLIRNETYPVNYHSVVWDGNNDDGQRISTGLYLVIFKTRERVFQQKLIMLK